MTDLILGSKYGPQNGVQNWVFAWAPFWVRFGLKSGVSHRKILLLSADVLQAELPRTSMSVSVNACFSLCASQFVAPTARILRDFILYLYPSQRMVFPDLGAAPMWSEVSCRF